MHSVERRSRDCLKQINRIDSRDIVCPSISKLISTQCFVLVIH
jgi:hypothetical protein